MKRQEILRRLIPEKGVLLTLVLGMAASIFYFGKLYKDPAHTYFSTGGDGFQIYYETIYHSRYDTKWWHQESTNYPYGESIFFTGALPFVNNLANIFDSTGSFAVWLINMLMLLSPVIGALFLYLIFRHLKLPWIYAAVCAVGVAYLSPQMMRMGGHYSLQWVFLLPAFIWLLLKFYDYPNAKKSWAIAFLVFLGGATHIYFLVFFLALGGMYWLVLFLTRDRGFGRFLFVLKHFSIQLLLPIVLIFIIQLLTDPVKDRTALAWGHFVFHSTMDGIFYPFFTPYEPLFGKIFKHTEPEWEGLTYVGMAAIIGLIVTLFVQLYRLFRRRFRLLLSVTDNKPLNILFWMSVVLAWIACAHPFIGGHEDWILYLGPLKQFRALGRFTWAFFYVANIIAVARVYRVFQRWRVVQYALCVVLAGFLYLDGYYYLKTYEDRFNNRIAELDDKANALPENQWLKNFDSKKYQAILPLPFYVVGSENLLKSPPTPEVVFRSYLASLQTGLPIMATQAARTSTGQSYQLLSLVTDPLHPISLLNDIHDKRPFLVLATFDSLTYNEKRLISLSTPVAETPKFRLFSLDPAALQNVYTNEYATVKAAFEERAKISSGPFFLADSNAQYIYRSFDNGNGAPYKGKASLSGKVRDFTVLYDSLVPQGNYVVSFWINHMKEDVYPRTVVEAFILDAAGKYPFYDAAGVQWRLKAFDGDWGLVEIPFRANSPGDKLKVSVWNNSLKPDRKLEVDEFMIRPDYAEIFGRSGDTYFHNNRYYAPPR